MTRLKELQLLQSSVIHISVFFFYLDQTKSDEISENTFGVFVILKYFEGRFMIYS